MRLKTIHIPTLLGNEAHKVKKFNQRCRAETLCTRANTALQAVRSVRAAVGTQRALLAAALGTAGGCCPGTVHRPCSAVSAEIHRKTRMGNNRKRCWNSGNQRFCTGSFGRCSLL